MARTTNVLTFELERGRPRVDMPKGTDLEIAPLGDGETKEWSNRIGCVSVTWLGRRRFIPAADLEALDVEAARILKGARAALRRKAA